MTAEPEMSFFALPKPPPAKWFRHLGLDDDGYRAHVAALLPSFELLHRYMRPDPDELTRHGAQVALTHLSDHEVSAWVTVGWLAHLAAEALPKLEAGKRWQLNDSRVPQSFRTALNHGPALTAVIEQATDALDDVGRHRFHRPIKDCGTDGVLTMMCLLFDAQAYAKGWLPPGQVPVTAEPRQGRNP